MTQFAPPPPVLDPPILKIRDPRFPQFLFEWHEGIQKVYVLGIPGKFVGETFVIALTGEAKAAVLSEHCYNHGQFIGIVQTYTRGYLQGLADQKTMLQGNKGT